jgi:hypothetical protein
MSRVFVTLTQLTAIEKAMREEDVVSGWLQRDPQDASRLQVVEFENADRDRVLVREPRFPDARKRVVTSREDSQ